MKCNNCGGTGHCNDVVMVEDGFATRVKHCAVCNGTGEIGQTEQEYLQTCDTEQLAEWIAHQTMIALLENQNNHSLRMTYPAYWVEWLKQPHIEKE